MNKTKFVLLFFCLCLISTDDIFSQTGTIPTGSDTSCVNGVSLFQKIYGGTKDDHAFHLTPATDSGYVIAGRTNSFGNGGYDGLLTKVNKKGNVLWSKAFGGSGDDIFYTVQRTSDGGFIACGQTKSYGNAAGDAWLVKLDALGTIQWSKKYGDGNVNGDGAVDVVQLSDGGYAIRGTHLYAPGTADGLVIRTDSQGNVIWSKSYGNWNSDDGAGILEDGNFLIVTGYYYAASYYDGYVMKLDKSNGAVQWIRGYDVENRSTWMSKITKTNTGYQVLSVVTDNFFDQNQQECIWNLNTDGTVQNVRKLVIPGVWTPSTGWFSLPDGGFIAANGENNSQSDIIVCHVKADGSLGFSKKYARPGKQVIYGITAGPEGGYALAGYNNNPGTVPDSNNVYLMKIDSLGDAGSCSGINTNDLTVVTPSYTTPTPDVASIGDVTINNPVITVGVVNFTPVTTAVCDFCGVQSTSPGGIPTGSDTTCANVSSLYQKVYGGSKNDYISSLASAADSGTVVVGQTNSFGGGGYDGLLMKVNKKGNVLWSKAVGGSGDDFLYKIRRTSDGGFISCGQTKSYGNPAGDAWLIKLDASGNIQWSKKYGDGNVNGESSADVVQLSDGGYAVMGTHKYTPGLADGFVVRTDAQGNVMWSKSYGNWNSDDGSGILEDGNFLVITGYYYAASYYDGYVMKLDKSNGAVQWIRGYDAENRSTWMGKLTKTNTGYQVLSVVTDNFFDQNQQECIWNLNTDGSVQNVRKLVIPGTWSSSYGWYPLADGGFIAANGENNNASDIIVCRVNADGSLGFSKKYARPGKQVIYEITAGPEGGYALAGYDNNPGTVPDSNNVYLMKIDSLGDAGSCSGINTNDLTVVTPSYTTPTPDVASIGDVTINNPVITAGAVNFTPLITAVCDFCGTSTPNSPDTTCANVSSLYQKVYGGSKNDYISSLASAADSGTVVVGQTNSFGGGGYDGLLMKVNKKGNVLWSKAVGGSGDDFLYKIRRTSDGGFISCGQTKSYGNPAGDAWLIKLDASGNIQWSKKYGDGNVNGESSADVVQLSDGGYAVMGTHKYTPGLADGFVVRTDAQGNVMWSKSYGNWNSDDGSGILEDGNFLVITGYYYAASYYDGYVMKLDKSNGAVQWIRGYDAENRSTWMGKLTKTNTGYQVLSVVTDNFFDQNQQECIWNLNTDGSVQNVRKLVIPGTWSSSYGWYPLADGGFIAANGENNNASDIIVCRVNADGSLGFSKKYARSGKQVIYEITAGPEGGYALAGYNNNPGTVPDSNNVYLMKIDSLGDAGSCSGINTNDLTVVTPSYTTPTPDVASIGDVTINNPVITVGVVNFTPLTTSLCVSCASKPTGSRFAAYTHNPYTIKVYPNPIEGGMINLSIAADHHDKAVISIVDLYGTNLYTSGRKEIRAGNNILSLRTPPQLRSYNNYFIRIRFTDFESSIKIFVNKH